jgi:ankyrin repeat protein
MVRFIDYRYRYRNFLLFYTVFLNKICNFFDRELVVNFVNTDIKLTADKASGKRTLSPDDSASLSPVRTKTVPTTVKASPLQSSTNKDRSRPKVNVHKRNKYGETALHTACKMGNLARIADCLG